MFVMRHLVRHHHFDLIFRITNTTNAAVTISVGGDDSQMNLDHAGPGAITADNLVAMTMEFRIGNPTTIPAGKTADIKISSLASLPMQLWKSRTIFGKGCGPSAEPSM